MELSRENQLAFIDNWIESSGSNQHALEIAAKVPVGTIKDLRRGKFAMRADRWQKIEHVISPKTSYKIPIIGEIGAGAEIHPIDDLPLMQTGIRVHEQVYMNCDFIDAPPGVYPSGIAALRINGDSMLPFMPSGTIVYYEQRIDGGCNDLIGKLCVVQLKDGRALVKTVRRGYSQGKFNLESYNASLIEDVEIEWCGKIIFIKPT